MTGFFDPARFPFTAPLEAACPALRAEADRVLARMAALDHSHSGFFARDGLLAGGTRGRFYLRFAGLRLQANEAACPVTAEVLAGVPGLVSGGFYLLGPQTHVRAHVGARQGVLRFHLGLRVPPGCSLRVLDEERPWREGRFLVFDDTLEHEAWNRSDEPRCVLHLDVLHPALEPAAEADHLRLLLRSVLESSPAYAVWLEAVSPAGDPAMVAEVRRLAEGDPRLAPRRDLAASGGLFFP